MPNQVTLPFGALEVLPGRQGIEDVVIQIPTLDEIVSAIQRETLDKTDLDEALVEAIGDGIDVTDDVVADIVREFELALGVDVPGDGSVIDAIARGVEDAVDLSDLDLPGAGQIDDIIRDVITEEFDLDGDGKVGINFSGVYGPLSEDIAEVLEDIINFDPQEFVDEILDFDEVKRAVTEALDGLSPDINGVEFWSNPIAFLDALLDRWHVRLVDPELLDELDEALGRTR